MEIPLLLQIPKILKHAKLEIDSSEVGKAEYINSEIDIWLKLTSPYYGPQINNICEGFLLEEYKHVSKQKITSIYYTRQPEEEKTATAHLRIENFRNIENMKFAIISSFYLYEDGSIKGKIFISGKDKGNSGEKQETEDVIVIEIENAKIVESYTMQNGEKIGATSEEKIVLENRVREWCGKIDKRGHRVIKVPTKEDFNFCQEQLESIQNQKRFRATTDTDTHSGIGEDQHGEGQH